MPEKRIAERLSQRLADGMLDEVAGLRSRGVSDVRLEKLGLEYRYRGDDAAAAFPAAHTAARFLFDRHRQGLSLLLLDATRAGRAWHVRLLCSAGGSEGRRVSLTEQKRQIAV